MFEINMAKRRTRKDKESAKHNFTISWKPEIEKVLFEPNVNRQTKNIKNHPHPKSVIRNNAESTEKGKNLASIKKDIFKSLTLALLILTSELMLYLFLKSK